MCRSIGICVVLSGLFLVFQQPTMSQNASLDQIYGAGVHAFFAGRNRDAFEQFTVAIDAGTTDPRCFY